MLRTLQTHHIGCYLRVFKVTTVITPSITVDIGISNISASTRNSAGKSTLTLNKQLVLPGIVVATAGDTADAGGYVGYDTDPASASIVTKVFDAAGTGKDGSAHILSVDYASSNTDRVFPRQTVKSTNSKPRLMGFRVTSGAAALGSAQLNGSITKASSVYTGTYANCFGRSPVILACPIAATQKAIQVTANSASSFSVATFSSAEAAQDNDFYMIVHGFDAIDSGGGGRKTPVQVPQLEPRLDAFRVTGSLGASAAIATGTNDATLTVNGTGDFTLTWTTAAYLREPIVIVSSKASRAQLAAAASTTSANILTFNATGSAADDDFCVFVLGYKHADEI